MNPLTLLAFGYARRVAAAIVVAAIAFTLLFTGVTFDFWWQMALTVAGLCLLSYVIDPSGFREMLRPGDVSLPKAIVLGVLSAAVLYGIFYVGHIVSGHIFGFARDNVAAVYTLKQGRSVWLIAPLMALVIGPGEEIFWRGYVQRSLSKPCPCLGLILSVAAYTAVHLASWNLMLLGAAFVCGAFWGLLYLRYRSIWLNIISHTVWDITVFLIFPFATHS